MTERLPSFFVMGAQKAGTTTLHDWLSQQPDVCLPRIKETHFFSDYRRFKLEIAWYLKQFPDCSDDAVVGEVDPDYAFYEETPLRIRDLIESPRFVFVFRHPVDRAFSHYQMSVRRGYETLSFYDALLAEDGRLSGPNRAFALSHHSYMARGRYSEQIARYRNIFPSSDFLYIKFGEMVSPLTRRETYTRICRFLDIRSSPALADLGKISNPASVPRSTLLRDLIYKQSPVRRTIGRLLGDSSIKRDIAMMLDRLNQKPLKRTNRDRESIEVPESLASEVREEIWRLEMMTGLDLQEWIRKGKFQ